MANGGINFANDSFKIILMQSGFVFNKKTHHGYADVSASELATGNGYTANTKVLAGVALVEDDTNDRCNITWSNAVWTTSGGAIGPSPGACIIDDTVAVNGVLWPADPVISYIDFGGNQTQADGGAATISNVETRIA
jgi:hypothetical protein